MHLKLFQKRDQFKAAILYVKTARWDGTKINHWVLIIVKSVRVGIFAANALFYIVLDAQRAKDKTPSHNRISPPIVLNVEKNIHFPTI